MPVLWGKGKEDTGTRKLPPTTQNAGMLSLAKAPASTEFVSTTPSQESCALVSREELDIPYNPTNGYNSDMVQCDLGVIPSRGSVTIDVTVTSTTPGEITNYAADTGESQASATVEVVEHP